MAKKKASKTKASVKKKSKTASRSKKKKTTKPGSKKPLQTSRTFMGLPMFFPDLVTDIPDYAGVTERLLKHKKGKTTFATEVLILLRKMATTD